MTAGMPELSSLSDRVGCQAIRNPACGVTCLGSKIRNGEYQPYLTFRAVDTVARWKKATPSI